MHNNKNKDGFTIIEVVLVLAIAGLIFLMVFIALPALQRNQRDTQRRNDMNRIFTAVEEYQKHNSGNLPFTYANKKYSFDKKFIKRYVDSSCSEMKTANLSGITTDDPQGGFYKVENCSQQFMDPDGTIYYIAYNQGTNVAAHEDGAPKLLDSWNFDHIIHFMLRTKCGDNEGELIYSSGARDFAMVMNLEGGSYYCRDNQ